MAKVNVNLDNVGGGFIPVGTHRARITACEPGQGGAGPYLKWTLEIRGGTANGKTITTITSLSQKALFKLKEFFEATGTAIPKGNFSFDTKAFIGKEMAIEVGEKRTDEGKIFSEVKAYKPLASMTETSAGAVQGDSDDELEVLEDDDDVVF